jgi:hypothetical protein
MYPSSRMKLIRTFGLLLAVATSLIFFGFTRGTSHASGTLPRSSTRTEITPATTISSCGSWHVVPVGYPRMNNGNFGFDGVAVISPSDVWAVGSLTEHWDGTKWSKVSPRVGLNGVAALSANNVWAVGDTNGSNVDGVSHMGNALIEHWDGTKWSVVPGTNLGSIYTHLNAVTTISANNIWAVGGDGNGTLIEHWNGIYWSAVPSQSLNFQYNELTSISAVSANDIWTVGNAWGPGILTQQQTLIEHWNGAQWSIIPSPNPAAYNHLNGVTAISAHNVWAVGEGGTPIEHWDGVQWSTVPLSVGGSFLAVTAISANNIWFIGFNSKGTLTEQWNGSSWNIVKSAKPQTGELLAVAGVPGTNTLWAVGTYVIGDYSDMLTEFYC